MTGTARSEPTCPPEVLDWIAWYGEANLPEEIRGTIDAHAAECAPCRDEIAALSGVSVDAITEFPDPERVFDRVRERISSGGAERPAAPGSGAPRRPRPVWVATRRAALAAGFVLLLAAGLAGAGIASLAQSPAGYVTVNDPRPAVSANVVQLDVVFRPEVAFGQIHNVLNELGASVVAGPTRGGVMRLHLPANSDPSDVASRLREDAGGVALFAEPVLP